MNDTVFGKIIEGTIPATKVYEDAQFLAFLDISPVSKGHTILIPKTQYERIHDVPDDVIAAIFIKAKEIINAMRAGIPCDYVQLSVIGNEVAHFHIHLIPRSTNEEAPLSHRPLTPYESDEEKHSFAEKISKGL